MVETGSDDILAEADRCDIAFLVVGDPFGYAHLCLCRSAGRDSDRQQGYYACRPSYPGSRAENSGSQYLKCLNPIRGWLHWLAAIQLRPDSKYGIFHRRMETVVLLWRMPALAFILLFF